MGAALGFMLGAGIRALGQHGEEKRQREMVHDQMLLNLYQQHPDIAAAPEAQQFLSKKYGKDVAEGFMHIGQMAQKAQQSMPQAGAGGQPEDPAAQITKYEQWLQQNGSYLNPAQLKAAQSHIQTLRAQMQESAQAKRQQAGFAQQEKLVGERGQQQEKLLGERQASEEKLLGERVGAEKQLLGARQAGEEKLAKEEGKIGGAGKPIDPALEHTRELTVVTKADALYKGENKEPTTIAGFGVDRHLVWQTKRAKAIKKAGGDLSLLGWTHGNSKSAGAGWLTGDGEFIPDASTE